MISSDRTTSDRWSESGQCAAHDACVLSVDETAVCHCEWRIVLPVGAGFVIRFANQRCRSDRERSVVHAYIVFRELIVRIVQHGCNGIIADTTGKGRRRFIGDGNVIPTLKAGDGAGQRWIGRTIEARCIIDLYHQFEARHS